jgi:type IV secretory pathway component VirB8
MKRTNFFFLFLLFSFYACKSKDKQTTGKSENNIDAARNFIRAALDGKFDEARNYLITDSVNMQFLDAVERSYKNQPADTINAYRGASIYIHKVQPVNDSISIVIYSNSFKNNHDTLKVLKVSGQWLVDLKYLYEHDAGTLPHKTVPNDTIK